ncbi:sensor histidine kinase [Nakamurella sp. GG22]
MEQARTGQEPLWGIAAGCAALLAVGAWFLGWRAFTPAECSTVFPAAQQWSALGVSPQAVGDCAVPETAVVTAATALGDQVSMTIVDNGAVSVLTVPMRASGVPSLLAGSWSTMAFVIALFGIGCYAFGRRRADPAAGALLLLSSGLLASTTTTVLGLPVHSVFGGFPRWLFLANVGAAYSVSWGGLLAFAALFPTAWHRVAGRVMPRMVLQTTPLALWLVGGAVLGAISLAGDSTFTGWVHGTIVVQSLITVGCLLTGLGVYCSRIFRSPPGRNSIERQQLLWVGASGTASILLVLAFWMIPQLITGTPLLPAGAIGVPGLLFVGGLTVALTRFRLFDLDALLGRTLVYSALTVLVVALYLGVVSVLTAAFSAPATTPTAVAGVAVVAVVVNPLRVGLQHAVNTLLYGDRDDPYTALSRVAEQLTAAARRTVVLPAVAVDVARALRVPYVGIVWHGEDNPGEASVGSRPANDALLYDVPLLFRGEQVGQLRIARRAPTEHFSSSERRLIADLSRQVAAAVREVLLSQELQRSRERLVLAREEERRVLRRTLHDEIGPTVAGIALRAETARLLVEQPDRRAGFASALAAIGRDAGAAARALRALSYDLRPPALDDRGLVLALQDRAAELSPLEVVIDAGDIDRQAGGRALPAAVEVAAYRITMGAMTNAARHAQATHCWVRLRRTGTELSVDIDDDGSGLPADFRAGVGVTAMRERARELGGDCRHLTRPDGGTRVAAVLPLSEDL